MPRYRLPFPHLSYSQKSLWEKDKQAYAEKYFKKKSLFRTKEIGFGGRFSQGLETGDYSEFSPDMIIAAFLLEDHGYHERRVEMHLIDGFSVLGFLDNCSNDMSFINEYKTGKDEWTQELVDENEQLLTYEMIVHSITGKKPLIKLQWLPTEDCDATWVHPEGVRFTKEIKTFVFNGGGQKRRNELKKRYKEILQEISDAYSFWIGELHPEIDYEFFKDYKYAETQYIRMKEEFERAKLRLDKRREDLLAEMNFNNVKWLEFDDSIFKITPTGRLSVKHLL